MNSPMILVIEDDAPVRNLIVTTLKTHDYRYLTAGTRSKPWTRGRTTISPSPSPWRSCWPDCGSPCGGCRS